MSSFDFSFLQEGLDFLGAVALEEDKEGRLTCGEIVAPDKLSDVRNLCVFCFSPQEKN